MSKESGEKSAKCLQPKMGQKLSGIKSTFMWALYIVSSSYRPEVTWRRGDGEMITVKTAGKKIKSK
jgi:hypothetical protein